MTALLYVGRDYRLSSYLNRPRVLPRGLRELRATGLWLGSTLRRSLFDTKIDGFFERSLRSIGGFEEVRPETVLRNARGVAGGESNLVVHYRCSGVALHGDDRLLMDLARAGRGATALYINDDRAGYMKSDAVLDCFDVIFKREPYIDLDRYPVAAHNRDKIRPTMLSCPSLGLLRWRAGDHRDSVSEVPESAKVHDVFFVGKGTSRRAELWRALLRSGLSCYGGLLPRHGFDMSEQLCFDRTLGARAFRRSMQRSRINLAISGHGEFTHRHLEILAAGGFLMSDIDLGHLWLPVDLQEGVHYVAFKTAAELVELAHYYSTHDRARNEIASAGRSALLRGYDYTKHGRFLAHALAERGSVGQPASRWRNRSLL